MGAVEETLTGEVLRLTYHDPVSSFTVARLKPHGETREVAIVGNLPLIQVGQQVRCTGTWEVDPRHGRQFVVQKHTYELPTNKASIERLIASGFLKGVGPVFAAKIVRRFGTQTFSILDNEPEKLYTIEGLGKRRAKRIIESWKERTQEQELFAILCDWGISQTMAMKILRLWGSEALATIQKNPYQLAKDIHGIGFQAADAIAKRLGVADDAPTRIDAAIEYFLWELGNEGHTCLSVEAFLPLAEERLSLPAAVISPRLMAGFQNGEIVLFTPSPERGLHVASKRLFFAEQHIASNLRRLLENPSRLRSVDVPKAVAWAEQTLKMVFADKQKEAVAATLSNKVTILTGGPGTGKSTITRAIVTIYSMLTKQIVLAAPTGRAAKRLQEMTGHYSQTIHRLLKFNPGTGLFEHNVENPIPCDLLIVDETSMIDTPLACSLLEAIPSQSRLLIVGDVDQLPSIGPGTILKDLIESESIPTVRLTEIYRQAKHSKIIENAHRINHGEMPFLKNEWGDFFFFPAKEPATICSTVLELVTQRIPEKFKFDAKREIQVLAPMRRGECGIEQLNVAFQNYFHNNGPKSGPFVVNDKVIQMKNNYQKEVFNGDIGFVRVIDAENGTICVEFDDRHVVYDGSDMDQLSLAWAVSIHKYQGSEAPCVVIPLHTQHFKLLNRNLLYTAVTRGKKLVVLVGSAQAIGIAVHQENSEQRQTNLKTALRQQPKSP
jgi:exodeoxyribonuclease V alpha subunit